MASPALTSAVTHPRSAPAWWRSLYADMTDPESAVAAQAVAEIRRELHHIAGPAVDCFDLETAACGVRAWSEREAEGYRQLWEDAEPAGGGRVLVRRAALGCAPLALVAGAWLQWLTSMAEADDALALLCLRLYAADVGVGHARDSRGHAFLALLRDLRLADNASPAAGIALDQRIDDRAFYLPAMLLLMSRRPDELRPEILGADRCLRAVGLPPPLALVRASDPTRSWSAMDLSGAHGPESVTAAQLSATAAAQCDPDRVALGFRWALAAVQTWHARLRSELLRSLDPAEEMAELLRVRAREGAAYHQSFALEGRPLTQWLIEAQTDPWPLLGVLSRSKLIRPGDPDRSPLITGLIGDRGAMFRVFDPEDLVVIRRWVAGLGGAASVVGAESAADDAEAPPALRYPLPAYRSAASDTGKFDLRTAYTLLQRRTITSELRRYAIEYVHAWLGRSGHRLQDASVMLPQRWPSEGLRPWLTAQHERHAAAFEQRAAGSLPTREELIESSVQLAPLTMIDGAWLQGFTDYELASSPIGFSLFETYYDELGNGEPRLNHPLIYRQLIAGMGHDLPPTGTLEFARWRGFKERSFELPVYWLSIGRFPRTFLPEILGLNLAMELSGVGGSYRSARIALKKHGFDTRFVDLHNTIDNVATGHSAWAADAINTFMATASTSAEPALREAAWTRIRCGFRSLNPPDGPMARWAAGRARRTSHRTSEGLYDD